MNPSVDIQFPILLSLEEAAQGTQRDFFYPSREMLCSQCRGQSGPAEDVCDLCEGWGRTFIPKRITITVPAGVNDQVRILVNGQGLLSPDLSQWGDLYLVCYIRPHATLQRQGSELMMKVGKEHRQNGRLVVNSLTGPLEVTLPENFDGTELRVEGLGFPKGIGSDSRGDLLLALGSPSSETDEDTFQQVKRQAQHFGKQGDWQKVVELLGKAEWDTLLDGESLNLLGVALARQGKTGPAREKLHRSSVVAPDNPTTIHNLGLIASQQQDYLAASVYFESVLQRNPTNDPSRQALSQSLSYLFRSDAGMASDEELRPALEEVFNSGQHRMYAGAAASARRLRESGSSGPMVAFLTYLEASAKLLSCFTGNEQVLGEVIDQFEVAESLAPDWKPAGLGKQAMREYVRLDANLLGLTSAALFELRRHCYGEACEFMKVAAARTRSVVPKIDQTINREDPVARRYEAIITGNILSLKRESRRCEDSCVEIPFLKGLIAVTESHEVILRTGLVRAGWLPCVRTVQWLELAVCQSPDRDDLVSEFHESIDLFNGIAGAMLNEIDPDEFHFVQNTHDAALQNLIPDSPINKLVEPGAPPMALRRVCESSYKSLFNHSRSPLRGEFLVAAVDGHFVLTNYRLLLLTDRLPRPQLLPLNVINRYGERAAGLNISTVIIGLSEGRQLILNNMANGTFPKDSVVAYLIGAQMWERLKPTEQFVLETGRDSVIPEMLPVQDQRVMQLPQRSESTLSLGSGAMDNNVCQHCGYSGRPEDVFCRQCGSRIASLPEAPAHKMLNSGG